MAAFGRISQCSQRLLVELKGVRPVRTFGHKIMTPMATVFKEQQEHFHGCSKERQASLDNGGELWGWLPKGLETAMQSQSLVLFKAI